LTERKMTVSIMGRLSQCACALCLMAAFLLCPGMPSVTGAAEGEAWDNPDEALLPVQTGGQPLVAGISVDPGDIDRDIDREGSGAVDETAITIEAVDQGGEGILAEATCLLTILGPDGAPAVSSQNGEVVEGVDITSSFGVLEGGVGAWSYAFNPPDAAETGYHTVLTDVFYGDVYDNTEEALWSMFGCDPARSSKSAYPGAGSADLYWYRNLPHAVYSSPAVAGDGTFYVGDKGGNLLAVDRRGMPVWTENLCDAPVYSSPAIGPNGTLYVGTDGETLVAVDRHSGEQKWAASLGGPVRSSPAVAGNGMVYVGCDDGWLYELKPYGAMNQLFQTGGPVRSSPAVAGDGTVYVGSDAGFLYAVNPDGSGKWLFGTGGPVRSSPTVLGDSAVAVGSKDGMVYAIESDTGTLHWSFATGGPVSTSPAAKDSWTFYAASSDGYLYAFHYYLGPLLWRFPYAMWNELKEVDPLLDEAGEHLLVVCQYESGEVIEGHVGSAKMHISAASNKLEWGYVEESSIETAAAIANLEAACEESGLAVTQVGEDVEAAEQAEQQAAQAYVDALPYAGMANQEIQASAAAYKAAADSYEQAVDDFGEMDEAYDEADKTAENLMTIEENKVKAYDAAVEGLEAAKLIVGEKQNIFDEAKKAYETAEAECEKELKELQEALGKWDQAKLNLSVLKDEASILKGIRDGKQGALDQLSISLDEALNDPDYVSAEDAYNAALVEEDVAQQKYDEEYEEWEEKDAALKELEKQWQENSDKIDELTQAGGPLDQAYDAWQAAKSIAGGLKGEAAEKEGEYLDALADYYAALEEFQQAQGAYSAAEAAYLQAAADYADAGNAYAQADAAYLQAEGAYNAAAAAHEAANAVLAQKLIVLQAAETVLTQAEAAAANAQQQSTSDPMAAQKAEWNKIDAEDLEEHAWDTYLLWEVAGGYQNYLEAVAIREEAYAGYADAQNGITFEEYDTIKVLENLIDAAWLVIDAYDVYCENYYVWGPDSSFTAAAEELYYVVLGNYDDVLADYEAAQGDYQTAVANEAVALAALQAAQTAYAAALQVYNNASTAAEKADQDRQKAWNAMKDAETIKDAAEAEKNAAKAVKNGAEAAKNAAKATKDVAEAALGQATADLDQKEGTYLAAELAWCNAQYEANEQKAEYDAQDAEVADAEAVLEYLTTPPGNSPLDHAQDDEEAAAIALGEAEMELGSKQDKVAVMWGAYAPYVDAVDGLAQQVEQAQKELADAEKEYQIMQDLVGEAQALEWDLGQKHLAALNEWNAANVAKQKAWGAMELAWGVLVSWELVMDAKEDAVIAADMAATAAGDAYETYNEDVLTKADEDWGTAHENKKKLKLEADIAKAKCDEVIGAMGVPVGTYAGALIAWADAIVALADAQGDLINAQTVNEHLWEALLSVENADGHLKEALDYEPPPPEPEWALSPSPAIGADGLIYACSPEGVLCALKDEGNRAVPIWMYATGEDTRSSPVIGAGRTTCVASGDGLYSFGTLFPGALFKVDDLEMTMDVAAGDGGVVTVSGQAWRQFGGAEATTLDYAEVVDAEDGPQATEFTDSAPPLGDSYSATYAPSAGVFEGNAWALDDTLDGAAYPGYGTIWAPLADPSKLDEPLVKVTATPATIDRDVDYPASSAVDEVTIEIEAVHPGGAHQLAHACVRIYAPDGSVADETYTLFEGLESPDGFTLKCEVIYNPPDSAPLEMLGEYDVLAIVTDTSGANWLSMLKGAFAVGDLAVSLEGVEGEFLPGQTVTVTGSASRFNGETSLDYAAVVDSCAGSHPADLIGGTEFSASYQVGEGLAGEIIAWAMDDTLDGVSGASSSTAYTIGGLPPRSLYMDLSTQKVDRDIDWEGSGAVDSVKITAAAFDPDGWENLEGGTCAITIRDPEGNAAQNSLDGEIVENLDISGNFGYVPSHPQVGGWSYEFNPLDSAITGKYIIEVGIQDSSGFHVYDEGAQWPQFGGKLSNVCADYDAGPGEGALLWTLALGDAEGYSSPVVAYDRIYVGSSTYNGSYGIFDLTDDRVHCIAAGSLEEIWSVDLESPVRSAPAVEEGRVYVATHDGVVRCLNAFTGHENWAFSSGSYGLSSSPKVWCGRLYIGSYNGSLYCLDALTGEELWEFETAGQVNSSPAVTSGLVFAASHNGRLYALDAYTGEEVWDYEVGGFAGSFPVVYQDTVYFGSHDGRICALSVDDGALLWEYEAGGSKQLSMAALHGRVYAGFAGGVVVCLDAGTGEEVWQEPFTGGHNPRLVLSGDDALYVASTDGTVRALDPDTGTVLWSVAVQDDVESFPALAGGRLYVNTFSGTLCALVPAGSSPQAAAPLASTITVEDLEVSINLDEPLPQQGEVLTVWGEAWRDYGLYQFTMYVEVEVIAPCEGGPVETQVEGKFSSPAEYGAQFTVTSPPLTECEVLVRARDPYGLNSVVDGISAKKYTVVPEPEGGAWPQFGRLGGNFGRSPYVGAPEKGLKWSFPGRGLFCVENGTVYLLDEDRVLRALDEKDGTEKWAYQGAKETGWLGGADAPSPPVVMDDGKVCFAAGDVLHEINGATGVHLGQTTAGGEIVGPVAVRNDTLYFSTRGEGGPAAVHAVGAGSGWTYEFGEGVEIASAPAVDDEGRVYVCAPTLTGHAIVRAIGPAGDEEWSRIIEYPALAPPAVADGVVCLAAENGRLWAFHTDGTPAWSFESDGYTGGAVPGGPPWAVPAFSPALAADGTVLWGEEKLYAIGQAGEYLWKYSLPGVLEFNSAVATDAMGVTYAVSTGGDLYAVEPDGSFRWVYEAAGPAVAAGPAIGSDGTVYFAADNLYAIYPPLPEGTAPSWIGREPTPTPTPDPREPTPTPTPDPRDPTPEPTPTPRPPDPTPIPSVTPVDPPIVYIINFGPPSVVTREGEYVDDGSVFGTRGSYGWRQWQSLVVE